MKSVNKRDTVLFLGAGFSSEAELPTMAKFGFASDEAGERLEKHKNNRYAYDLYANAYAGFREVRSIFQRARRHVKIKINNMEMIFCMAEAMKESKIRRISTQRRKDIKRWLWKIYQQCPPAQPRKEYLGVPYAEFLNILKRRIDLSRISVLTTNYDLIFEYLAWKQGIVCEYPFNPGTAQRCRLLVCDKPFVFVNPVGGNPIVCKLHGSVNYFKMDRQDKILHVMDNVVSADLPYEQAHIGKSYVPRLPEVFAFDALSELKKRSLPSIPEIVPPTYSKFERKAWLREIWYTAFTAIRNASQVIFIGYSLPPTDGFMYAMIRSAMAVRKKEASPRIYVINPIRHKAYSLLFRNGMISYIDLKFSDAIASGSIERILTECGNL